MSPPWNRGDPRYPRSPGSHRPPAARYALLVARGGRTHITVQSRQATDPLIHTT